MKKTSKQMAPVAGDNLPTRTPIASPAPESATKKSSWIAQLLLIVTPCLIGANYLYSYGYIAALGLDPDLFARSPDQHIAKSLITVPTLFAELMPSFGTWAVGALATLAGFILLVLLFYGLNKIPAPRKLLHHVEKFKPLLDSAPGRSISLGVAFTYLAINLPIMAAMAFLFLIAPIYFVGERVAIRNIDDFVSHGACAPKTQNRRTRHSACVTVSPGKDLAPIEGLLLVSTEKAIAVYDPKDSVVKVIYPKDGPVAASTFLPAK